VLRDLRQGPNVTALLDVDPDLAPGLSDDAVAQARRRAVATTIDLEPPTWDPARIRDVARHDWLGLFVVEVLAMLVRTRYEPTYRGSRATVPRRR
jgi:hypothetical protein